eukprot:403331969
MEINKDKYSFEEIETEQKQIEDCYLTLRFAQKVRKETLACYKRCGGEMMYPYYPEPAKLVGTHEICFSDCLNINYEKGPFLRELGQVPQDAIPKKFVWAHSV